MWLQGKTDAPDSDGETGMDGRAWRMSCFPESYEDCKPETSLVPLLLSNEMLSGAEQ